MVLRMLFSFAPCFLPAQHCQAKLHCAAQHIFWSSIYGGVLGDDGRYDAFETTMEILRVRLLHPGLPGDELEAKDEGFRRFMRCESSECC